MHTQDPIHTLNALIETCNNGDRGFRNAAQHAHAPDLRDFFLRRAEECQEACLELRAEVVQLGGTAATGGTAGGAIRRGWASLLEMLSSDSDLTMLEACERGEDAAMAEYRDALAQPLPDDIRQLIERQYEGVKRNHNAVRSLRDQARAMHS